MEKTAGLRRHLARTQILFSLLVVTNILILAFWYFHLSLSFPYYFAFDMDLAAAAESLNINSGKPAYAVIHSGYGMYVVNSLTHRLASSVGLVSVLTLSELDSALNPIAVIAELTDFFRLQSPLVVLVIVLALWSAFSLFFRWPRLYSLGLLIAIGTLESLAIQASLIRYELYSIFFWSLAIVCVAVWVRIKRQEASWAMLFLIGLFLGMSLLAKYQSIFNIAMVFTLAPLLLLDQPRFLEHLSQPVSAAQRKIMDALSIAVFVSWTMLFVFAFRQPRSPVLFQQALEPGGLSLIGAAFLGLIGSCTLTHLMLRALKRHTPALLRTLFSIHVILIGVLVAVLSPLVLYSNLSTGWEYAISNTHATFFIQSQAVSSSISESFEKLTDLIVYQPATYAIYLISILILLAGILSRRFRVPRIYALSPLFTTVIVVAGTLFAVRPVARDLIWTDTMLLLPSFIYLGIIVRYWPSPKWIPHLLASSALVIILFVNGIHLLDFRPQFAAHQARYGWVSAEFFGTFYTSPEYNAIMSDHYPEESMPSSAFRARRFREDKQIASNVFQNLHVGLDSMSFVETGRPVWKNDQRWKIQSFPEKYEDSLVVDVSWQVPENKYFFTDVRGFVEKLDHIVEAPKRGKPLSILSKRDLDVLIFVELHDYQGLHGTNPWLLGPELPKRRRRITVHDGTSERTLFGLTVNQYAVIQTEKIAHPFFFVIRERMDSRRNRLGGSRPHDGPA